MSSMESKSSGHGNETSQNNVAHRHDLSSPAFRAHETVRKFSDWLRSFRQSGGVPGGPPEPDDQGGGVSQTMRMR